MPASTDTTASDLAAAVDGFLRPGGPADAVDGVLPRWVAVPDSTEATSALLGAAARHGLSVLARGAGTKLTWGHPPTSADLLVDTGRMDRIIEHAHGDLVVRTQAGVRLGALNAALAPSGQRLALDPVVAGGTIGGTIATGASGPLRLSHGAVRDLLIGVTMVRADGKVAKAGGTVVKNVAGYDLAKLLTGSWGTLGLVTEAVFRLHPLPAARRWVTVPATVPGEIHDHVQRVIASPLVPAALEIDVGVSPAGGRRGGLSVLLEGTPAGVEDRTDRLLTLLGRTARADDQPPPWWGQTPEAAGGTVLRMTHEIAGCAPLLVAVTQITTDRHVPALVRGSAAVGVLHVALPAGDPRTVADVVTQLRSRAGGWGGQVVVLTAPPAVTALVDVWGQAQGIELMRRVKDRFDPEHRLAPGRFVGGI